MAGPASIDQKIRLARKMGIPEQKIQSKLSSMGMGQERNQFQGIGGALINPASKYINTVGEAVGQVATRFTPEYRQLKQKRESGNLSIEEAKRLEQLVSPKLISEQSARDFSTPGGAL